MSPTSQYHHTDLLHNNSVSRTRNAAKTLLMQKLDEDITAPIHASDQDDYSNWSEQEGRKSPLAKFFYYRYGPEDIDNDVSALATVARCILHPALDLSSFSRQYYDEGTRGDRIIVFKKKFQVWAKDRDQVFRGDTCTSAFTPLKTFANHYMTENANSDKTKRLRALLGADAISKSSQLKVIWDDAGSRDLLIDAIEDILPASANDFLGCSDTLGNMIACPIGCNTTRVNNTGTNDTIDYYLAHIHMFFENDRDIRYLHRLFAQYRLHGIGRNIYPTFDSIDEVRSEPVSFAAKNFLGMIELFEIDSWKRFVSEFRLAAFCDEDLNPLSMMTGKAIGWNGEKHLDVCPSNATEDEARFENLANCISKRNECINSVLASSLGVG